MPRRFQFSLGRLLASATAFCLAAAAFVNGLAAARHSMNAWPLLIGWMVGELNELPGTEESVVLDT